MKRKIVIYDALSNKQATLVCDSKKDASFLMELLFETKYEAVMTTIDD